MTPVGALSRWRARVSLICSAWRIAYHNAYFTMARYRQRVFELSKAKPFVATVIKGASRYSSCDFIQRLVAIAETTREKRHDRHLDKFTRIKCNRMMEKLLIRLFFICARIIFKWIFFFFRKWQAAFDRIGTRCWLDRIINTNKKGDVYYSQPSSITHSWISNKVLYQTFSVYNWFINASRLTAMSYYRQN